MMENTPPLSPAEEDAGAAGYHKNPHAWVVLLAAAVVYALPISSNMQLGQFLPEMAKDLHASMAQVSLTLSLFGIGCLLTVPLAGRLIGKVPFKPYYAICVAVVLLCFAGLGVAQNLWQLYVLSFVAGAAQGLALQVMTPILIGNWFSEKTGMALGLSMASSGTFSMLIGPVIAQMILGMGWRKTALLLFGVEALVCAAVIVAFLSLRPEDKGQRPYGYRPGAHGAGPAAVEGVPERKAMRTAPFWLLFAAYALVQLVNGFLQILPSYGRSLGMTVPAAALILSFAMLGNLGSKLSFGFLSDRFDFRKVTLGLLAVITAGCALLLFGGGQTLAIYLGAVGLGGGAGYAAVAGALLLRKTFGSLDYTKLLSTAMIAQMVAGAIATPLYGAIYDATRSYHLALGILAISGALAFLVVAIETRYIGTLPFERRAAP